MKETFWALVVMFVLIGMVMCEPAKAGGRGLVQDECGSQWAQCGTVRAQ